MIELCGVVAVVLRSASPAAQEDTWLEVTQHGLTVASPSHAWLALPPASDDVQPEPTPLRTRSRAAAAPGGEVINRILALVPPASSGQQWQPQDPFAITLFQGKRAFGTATVSAGSLTVQTLMVDGLGGALAGALMEAGNPDIAAVLAASCSIKPLDHAAPVRIRQQIAVGAGLVLEGLVTLEPGLSIHIVTGDLQTWLPPSSVSLRRRTNLGAVAPLAGSREAASNEHEFVTVIPNPKGNTRELYVVGLAADRKTATFYGPVRHPVSNDPEVALRLVRTAFGDIRAMDKDRADRIYRPLLSTPKGEIAAERFAYGPPVRTDRPVASIIIPFYGDAFFLHCAHHLQRVLDDSFELVLVVDDPRIWPEISHALSLRKSAIRIPTSLVRNFSNYGFGVANNIGARLARGDVLFLMNSDVLVTEAAPLRAAAEAIRTRRREGRPELVTGFSLLYEDQTIQHIGMEFRRSSYMGDLYTAEHPMKGLPFAFYEGGGIRSVPAVTAALLAISKVFFQGLGGFDPAYERGDFEDADLCLKAREAGADIQVHVHPGLYHLERQSIPSMGDGTLREMVTYMNCLEFNRRWDAVLSRPKRVHRIRRQGQAA